jgi:hypothetical protein
MRMTKLREGGTLEPSLPARGFGLQPGGREAHKRVWTLTGGRARGVQEPESLRVITTYMLGLPFGSRGRRNEP